jgi:putative membrane protein
MYDPGHRQLKMIMNLRNPSTILKVAILILSSTLVANAADNLSDADKAFIAKVSQGGMYEVELGTLAETKGATQDIRDSGNTEAHDHGLVGAKLKSIIEANGLEFPKALNDEFQTRLEKLKALPSDKFDAAYVKDMKLIHDADGAAFAKEATGGTNPDLKAFAAETHRIVVRHLGELGAKAN